MSMEDKSRSFTSPVLFFWMILLQCFFPAYSASQIKSFDFTSNKGLKVKIIQDPEMAFMHAQLIIKIGSDPSYAPIVPELTLFHMFEEKWRRASGSLSEQLRRLGNDFDFLLTPGYVLISINWLPGREGNFASFIKEVFDYNGLTLKHFLEMKKDFWALFRRVPDWKKRLAEMVAYSHIFSGSPMGKTLITSDQLRTVNLAQLIAFYRDHILPGQSFLVIRGDSNPFQLWGMIEKELSTVRVKGNGKKPPVSPLKVNENRKVFLVDVRDSESPQLFFYDVAPSIENPDLISFYIINFTLFHFPTGRVYLPRSANFSMRNYPVSNELTIHRNISVFSSQLRVNPSDIDSIIQLFDSEKKRLFQQGIQRREYSDALNYLNGKNHVDSTLFSYEVELEIGRFLTDRSEVYSMLSQQNLQKASFDGIGGIMEQYFGGGGGQRSAGRERGVVVCVGNAEALLKNFRNTKPEIIKFFE